MSINTLMAKPLTPKDFAPFGDVIGANAQPTPINQGHTLRFDTGARLELTAKGGRAGVSIFRSTPLPTPIQIEVMERHPLSSQAFYPLSGHPFLVVVAPRGTFDAAKVCGFFASPDQGVNYHPGVWHHYLLALNEISDFLVVDRLGDDENCDTIRLKPALSVELP